VELPTLAGPDDVTSMAAAGRFGSPLGERSNSLLFIYTMNLELCWELELEVVKRWGIGVEKML